jgi:hypothetical protein
VQETTRSGEAKELMGMMVSNENFGDLSSYILLLILLTYIILYHEYMDK